MCILFAFWWVDDLKTIPWEDVEAVDTMTCIEPAVDRPLHSVMWRGVVDTVIRLGEYFHMNCMAHAYSKLDSILLHGRLDEQLEDESKPMFGSRLIEPRFVYRTERGPSLASKRNLRSFWLGLDRFDICALRIFDPGPSGELVPVSNWGLFREGWR